MFLKIPSYPVLLTCLDCAVLFKKDLIYPLKKNQTVVSGSRHLEELWEICRQGVVTNLSLSNGLWLLHSEQI